MPSGLHIADHSWVLDEAIFKFVLVLNIIVYLLFFFLSPTGILPLSGRLLGCKGPM